MSVYTTEDVIKTMREVVAEHGEDYEYERVVVYEDLPAGECRYGDTEGNPSCLVGHVIYRLDRDEYENLITKEAEEGSAPILVAQTGGYITPGLFDEDALCVLAEAQAIQDDQGTWGLALSHAEQFAAAKGYDI